jgi:methionyl-tRNA formyltransferase
MKIVFMGTPKFSVPILEKLHEIYGVGLVVTQPDKMVGRKRIITPSPVKEKAVELGIEVFQPKSIKQNYQRLIDYRPELIITAAYGQIIPKEVIDLPPLGSINVHGSLLPKLRGGAPIQRAIQRGHDKTGITIMYMAMAMDSGDIITKKEIPILPTDTSGILFDKLSTLGRDLLIETLPDIIAGTADRIVQDESEVTFAYNLKKSEEKLDWNQTREAVDQHIRAFYPNPTCYTTIDSKRIKLHQAVPSSQPLASDHEQLENGTIVALDDNFVRVKVKNGYVDIKKLQLAGKKAMDIKTFLNGAGRNIIKPLKMFQ